MLASDSLLVTSLIAFWQKQTFLDTSLTRFSWAQLFFSCLNPCWTLQAEWVETFKWLLMGLLCMLCLVKQPSPITWFTTRGECMSWDYFATTVPYQSHFYICWMETTTPQYHFKFRSSSNHFQKVPAIYRNHHCIAFLAVGRKKVVPCSVVLSIQYWRNHTLNMLAMT